MNKTTNRRGALERGRAERPANLPAYEPVALGTNWTDRLSIRRLSGRAGKIKPVILMWGLGVPLPILVIVFLLRGCEA